MHENINEPFGYWLLCIELPEEKDKGIVLSLQSAYATQDTMLTVDRQLLKPLQHMN